MTYQTPTIDTMMPACTMVQSTGKGSSNCNDAGRPGGGGGTHSTTGAYEIDE